MTAPVLADCAGCWRRTLRFESDGTRDTGTSVTWLQGPTGYVDSRGFAGTLHQDGDAFQWHRDVDLGPPRPLPDAGSMRWQGNTLVETGIHADYVEHWVRDDQPTQPCGALFLTGVGGQPGLLVRVGPTFGWAGGGEVLIGAVATPRWDALVIDVASRHVLADGVRWFISRREGNVTP